MYIPLAMILVPLFDIRDQALLSKPFVFDMDLEALICFNHRKYSFAIRTGNAIPSVRKFKIFLGDSNSLSTIVLAIECREENLVIVFFHCLKLLSKN